VTEAGGANYGHGRETEQEGHKETTKQQETSRAAEVAGMTLPKIDSTLRQGEKQETCAKQWSSSTVGAAL
jgi:hypothetical protein